MNTKDNKQSEYNVKYIDLRNKHAQILYDAIDSARDMAIDLTSKVVPSELFKLIDETKNLKKLINAQRKLFFKSEEYKSEQKKLSYLKEQLNHCSADQKEDLQKQISKSMATIVTLNLTIKNRLKTQTDKVKMNEDYIDGQIELLDEELQKVKSKVMGYLRERLVLCVRDYNEELNNLRSEYGLLKLEETELPIDKNLLTLDIPIFSLKKTLSSESYDTESAFCEEQVKEDAPIKEEDDEYKNQTFIVSENTSNVKN